MVDETLRILQAAEAHASVGELHLVLPARLIERESTRRRRARLGNAVTTPLKARFDDSGT
jgi:hypothetical protein